jgi:RHS repeat-associated protein
MTIPAVCATTSCFSPSRSTGKERDTESGNDYFEARYYSSSMGRFMSPDWSAKEEPVPYAQLDNPQSLNLYSYMFNNPLGGVDADGHGCGGPGEAPCQAPAPPPSPTPASENDKFNACVKNIEKPPTVTATGVVKDIVKAGLKGAVENLPNAIQGKSPSGADIAQGVPKGIDKAWTNVFKTQMEANAVCIEAHPTAALSPDFKSPLDPGGNATGSMGVLQMLGSSTAFGSNSGTDGIQYWSVQYYMDHPGTLPADVK